MSSQRLEQLWAGEFGDAYLHRNIDAGHGRGWFWHELFNHFPFDSVLEIGCTQGDNLQWIADLVPSERIWGLDVNPVVLNKLRSNIPGAHGVRGVARSLPFPDRAFDLVFTVGLLIHIPDESLAHVMAEMTRVSRRYVFCGEYHSQEPTEVRYRDRDGVLFKRDYKRLFAANAAGIRLVDEGFLTKEQGFDRVTWHLFER